MKFFLIDFFFKKRIKESYILKIKSIIKYIIYKFFSKYFYLEEKYYTTENRIFIFVKKKKRNKKKFFLVKYININFFKKKNINIFKYKKIFFYKKKKIFLLTLKKHSIKFNKFTNIFLRKFFLKEKGNFRINFFNRKNIEIKNLYNLMFFNKSSYSNNIFNDYTYSNTLFLKKIYINRNYKKKFLENNIIISKNTRIKILKKYLKKKLFKKKINSEYFDFIYFFLNKKINKQKKSYFIKYAKKKHKILYYGNNIFIYLNNYRCKIEEKKNKFIFKNLLNNFKKEYAYFKFLFFIKKNIVIKSKTIFNNNIFILFLKCSVILLKIIKSLNIKFNIFKFLYKYFIIIFYKNINFYQKEIFLIKIFISKIFYKENLNIKKNNILNNIINLAKYYIKIKNFDEFNFIVFDFLKLNKINSTVLKIINVYKKFNIFLNFDNIFKCFFLFKKKLFVNIFKKIIRKKINKYLLINIYSCNISKLFKFSESINNSFLILIKRILYFSSFNIKKIINKNSILLIKAKKFVNKPSATNFLKFKKNVEEFIKNKKIICQDKKKTIENISIFKKIKKLFNNFIKFEYINKYY
ncbi:hypothetical protein [Candidatus Vidania fulgoroideorum]